MSKKINIYIFLIVVLLGKASGSTVTNCEIGGIVKDSITGEGLPFASVQILSQEDSSILKGTITDVSGSYVIKDMVSGKYRLIASYMGYNEKEIIIDIQAKKEKYNFLLSQKSFSLSEVEVASEKNLIEKSIQKTTINVAKDATLVGGTATDVMQTLPSVDVDIDGNINYRGSDKVIILLNGEKSELVKSLDQIPADQIEKIELINNPSARYEAEGMSGIINIVLKSKNSGSNKTTMMLYSGYTETAGGNIGYSKASGKTKFFVNAGINHKTKYQTKEHLRENYENPNVSNYYQFDRQDEILNSAFLNTNIKHTINKKQQVGLSLIGSKKANSADREINYETQNEIGNIEAESFKEIGIVLDNYTVDGNADYRYNFNKKERFLKVNYHYSLLSQLQQMNNVFYPEINTANTELQNTFSEQLNKKSDLSLNYSHPINDSILFEAGYSFGAKDLLNDFYSKEYSNNTSAWVEDTALANQFNYIQQINAVYLNLNTKLKFLEIQAGARVEYTSNSQNKQSQDEYLDFFPSVNISKKINNKFTVFASYNRRINRPSIKMLNPFTDEYADILNMHKGNPDLKPEYVNSFEIGNRFIFNKFSGLASVYYRDINQAISRIKSASNDSALVVSFMNLDKAKLFGGEITFSYKIFKWWNINTSGNIFQTNLNGEYENNIVSNSLIGWNTNVSNQIKLSKELSFQLSAYYRSKLPSVTGTYQERYYMDMAVKKKIFKNKGSLVFKISDIFNTYKFGLDLDAIDENNYRYSQTNRRKNESRYFVLSFIYNIDSKEQKKKQKTNFFLDGFDK